MLFNVVESILLLLLRKFFRIKNQIFEKKLNKKLLLKNLDDDQQKRFFCLVPINDFEMEKNSHLSIRKKQNN